MSAVSPNLVNADTSARRKFVRVGYWTRSVQAKSLLPICSIDHVRVGDTERTSGTRRRGQAHRHGGCEAEILGRRPGGPAVWQWCVRTRSMVRCRSLVRTSYTGTGGGV